VTYGTVRATRAAKAAAVILTAVSCSVYDASLLGSGPAEGGSSGTNSAAGSAGQVSAAGRSGSAGTANGGASAGDAGMMDTAGAMELGGDTGEGGSTGGSGTAGKGGSGAGAGGNAGSGGTVAGSGGTVAGSGGTAAGSGGTTAGSGGTAAGSGGTVAGSGGTAGGSAGVTGCAKLSVPMDDSGDRAHFVISLTSAADLSSATTGIVSMRLFVQAGAAGTVFNYVQDSQFHYFGVTTALRPSLKGVSGWQTLTFNVGAQAAGTSGIVKTDIRRIGIEINAAPDTAGWSNPTVVYVDSITVMTPALSFPLDTAATVSTTPTGSDVSGQVMWPHNGSTDTTAANVTLSWVATCP
jgi:hypothetical protein